MVQSVIQHGFHAGEWAPALYARVDLAKYKAGAALLENFYVDYRGGASSRPGTKYVIQAKSNTGPVRLIPFQASVNVGYILEFGEQYIRFHFEGAPVLTDIAAGITNVSGSTVTAANGTQPGDWVFIDNVVGINNINNKYFIVDTSTGADFTVTDLFGNAVTFTGAYVSGGDIGLVYTIGTPYADGDLALLKFTQNVDKMYICHPSYPPSILTIIEDDNWTLSPIVFGSTMGAVGGLGAATTNAGANHYSYIVTALDANNQESNASAVVSQTVNNAAAANATINLTWTAVTGAASYNVYRTPGRDGADPPTGSTFGFVMNVTQVAASDLFIGGAPQNLADFSTSVPIARNPFGPPGVASVTVTSAGNYTSCPAVTFDPSPLGTTAQGSSVLGALSIAITSSGNGHSVGEVMNGKIGTSIIVTSVNGFGQVLTADIHGLGAVSSGTTPANPMTFQSSVPGTVQGNVTWGVVSITINNPGSGYTSVPNITFSGGAAAATANLQPDTSGNPSVPGLFQQRLVLAAKPNAVQTFNMSQPGSYYNFDETNPILASDAIEATIVDGQLNKIVSMVSVPTGLVLLTSRSNWLVSGSQGPVTPIDLQAHAHSYNGASDVPPIVANFDILFVQSKGSIVRDLTFNFYTQIYTGTDISVLSSHLFYGHNIKEWCWAEEPFKIVWAVRDDGVALSLTFLKEQELIGWAHSVTDGFFISTAAVTESSEFESGLRDAVYFAIVREIDGNFVTYIERLAERQFPDGVVDAWCVDSGLLYIGPPVSNFSGMEHLVGKTVTGLADGNVITPFVMDASGDFTLDTPASVVTVGLAFEPKLQTLPLDIGEPTIQGKRKGINGVTVRVQDTLGLFIGKDFDSGVAMKDLVVGNVGSASNEIVTNLVTGDARTIIDPSWDVPGQYCIKQPNPLPVTILGVIPEIGVGDTK